MSKPLPAFAVLIEAPKQHEWIVTILLRHKRGKQFVVFEQKRFTIKSSLDRYVASLYLPDDTVMIEVKPNGQ